MLVKGEFRIIETPSNNSKSRFATAEISVRCQICLSRYRAYAEYHFLSWQPIREFTISAWRFSGEFSARLLIISRLISSPAELSRRPVISVTWDFGVIPQTHYPLNSIWHRRIYRLAFTQLHDSARFSVDGQLVGMNCTAYELDFELASGKHRLISNSTTPRNRDCLVIAHRTPPRSLTTHPHHAPRTTHHAPRTTHHTAPRTRTCPVPAFCPCTCPCTPHPTLSPAPCTLIFAVVRCLALPFIGVSRGH